MYANELSFIYSELDHHRPPIHNSVDREYTLDDIFQTFTRAET